MILLYKSLKNLIMAVIMLFVIFILLGVTVHLFFYFMSFIFYLVLFITSWKFLKFLFRTHNLKGK